MRPPVPHQPVQPPRPRYPTSIDDEDGSLPPSRHMADDDDPRSLDRMLGMAGDLAPIVDWDVFDDTTPPLQERRRR